MESELSPRQAGSATVNPTPRGWRLEMPAGSPRTYRLAQLDNYGRISRRHLAHRPPFSFDLRARVSAPNLPGTWGFGLWNDPFGMSLGFGGKPARLPTLPQTVWFVHASPPNWLSIRDDPLSPSGQSIPANGFMAGTYCSPRLPAIFLIPGLLAFPLCAIRSISRLFRHLVNRLIHQDAILINVDVREWHSYSLNWLGETCSFSVDECMVFTTPCSPQPPLGLVIWIDNQFAAWTPQGRIAYGILENPAAWMEIENLKFFHE